VTWLGVIQDSTSSYSRVVPTGLVFVGRSAQCGATGTDVAQGKAPWDNDGSYDGTRSHLQSLSGTNTASLTALWFQCHAILQPCDPVGRLLLRSFAQYFVPLHAHFLLHEAL
jgi:hypothetical protein